MSDKELLDWLASRNYVEATNSGNEDPKRFEFQRSFDADDFRVALSKHIKGETRRRVTDGIKTFRIGL